MSMFRREVKQFSREYYREIWVLIGALSFAFLGDLFYGGLAGAEESLVGLVLIGTSTLFSTVLLMLILFRLVTKGFFSKHFFNCMEKYTREEEPKKGAKKK